MTSRLTLSLAATLAAGVLFTGCTVDTDTGSAGGSNSGTTASEDHPDYTPSQANAVRSAQEYLAMGSGFSRAGMIEQLTAKTGEGFSRPDAVFAVNHIKVNWRKQAVLSAKGYLKMSGFSRTGLIEQLTAKTGEQFTLKQATFAADQVGLK